jgi:hypothetical protein
MESLCSFNGECGSCCHGGMSQSENGQDSDSLLELHFEVDSQGLMNVFVVSTLKGLDALDALSPSWHQHVPPLALGVISSNLEPKQYRFRFSHGLN